MAESSYSGSTTHDMKEKATGKFEKMADKATDKFKSAADGGENVANRVRKQGREAGENLQEFAGNLKGAVHRSVKDQPMATLAMAAVLASYSAPSKSRKLTDR